MADPLVDDLKRALGDAYRIERELPGGGMSRVFVAREHALGREVVIKVLPPELAAGVNRDRFRREVQLAARLSHPYIVPLLHAGEHGELLWFTMPYIPGESLRTRLAGQHALAVPEVVRLLHDVVEALAYAHARGVVHRDIKPANILYDGQHAVVLDFGVAKAINAALPMAGRGHTTSGMAIGTPAYMAPEQLAADPDADQRVDIYAVGLLAYELLSGTSPFTAGSPTATMTAQMTKVPEPLKQLRPGIPAALSDLVQHCLAKNPADRPPDAQAVLVELDRISGALAADIHRSTRGEETMRAPASSTPLVLALFVVVALIAAGFWWTRRGAAAPMGRDTTATRLSADTDLTALLPPRPMTHQDSLKLLEDLQEQLGQADPKYAARATTKPAPVSDQAPLDVQVARTDSLIKARLQVLYSQPGGPGGRGAAPGSPPESGRPAAGNPGAPGTVPGSRRLLVIAMPRGRADSTLTAIQRRAAADLVARTSRGGVSWGEVTVDTVDGRGRGSFATRPDANVLAFVSVQRDTGDSVRLSIMIRNADSSTNFTGRAVTSAPAYKATSADAFFGTISDAAHLLRQLRQLPLGQPWVADTGRGGNQGNAAGRGGRGGPFVSGERRTRQDSLP